MPAGAGLLCTRAHAIRLMHALHLAGGRPAWHCMSVMKAGLRPCPLCMHAAPPTPSGPRRPTTAAQGVRTGRSVLHHSVSSTDGTRKFLLQLADGRVVETVRGRRGRARAGNPHRWQAWLTAQAATAEQKRALAVLAPAGLGWAACSCYLGPPAQGHARPRLSHVPAGWAPPAQAGRGPPPRPPPQGCRCARRACLRQPLPLPCSAGGHPGGWGGPQEAHRLRQLAGGPPMGGLVKRGRLGSKAAVLAEAARGPKPCGRSTVCG